MKWCSPSVSSEAQRLGRALLALTVSLLACTDDGGDDESAPQCVDIDYDGCALLYPPTWEQVWTQTISTQCSGGGAACHASDERVRFDDQAAAYEGLMHEIVVGDPGCSHLMVRLESDDPDFRMPPGNTPISDGARCSIATWIADGASQD